MNFGVAIDPGKRHAGVTIFDVDRRMITKAGLVKGDNTELEGPEAVVKLAGAILRWVFQGEIPGQLIHTLVVEWPQTYDGRASVGDANDLLPLVGLDCALAMRACQTTMYRPNEWGALGKPKSTKEPYAVEERVRARLTPEELKLVTWPTDIRRSWDVTDSLALALKYLGRYERARAFARE